MTTFDKAWYMFLMACGLITMACGIAFAAFDGDYQRGTYFVSLGGFIYLIHMLGAHIKSGGK